MVTSRCDRFGPRVRATLGLAVIVLGGCTSGPSPAATSSVTPASPEAVETSAPSSTSTLTFTDAVPVAQDLHLDVAGARHPCGARA